MPTTHYFEKFPRIIYENYSAVDIVSNARLVERFINSPYVYYPYEVSSDQRPDVLSDQYYDDSYFSWLIYYGNQIVDPYYGWYLADDDFNRFIVSKYGSIENAQKRVAFYRTNWYSDSRQLSTSMFENTIGSHEKKYWDRKYNEEVGILLYYYRKPMDIMVNTNRIVTYETTNVGQFNTGDLVDIRRGANNVGTAEVVIADSTSVTVRHVYLDQGDVVAGDVLRKDNNVEVYSTVSRQLRITINIPASEMTYWEPVSYYDYETEQNISKKTIKLIDNKLSLTISEAFSDAMGT